MKTRCLLLILLVNLLEHSLADEINSHKLVKRQTPSRAGSRAFPLSRSRQFPPPEELEESDEYVNSEDEEEDKNAAAPFRGRPPQRPPSVEEEYADDYSYTEAPKKTTPAAATQKPTARTIIFNNRFAGRPRFGSVSSTVATTQAPKPSTSSSRFRATPAQSQRLDVVANILNKPPSPRSSERSSSSSRTSNLNAEKKPDTTSETSIRRNTSGRPKTRGRFRTRTSSTTTTTTTTTTEQPLEEYYYYYDDEGGDHQKNQQPIVTTTSTTTTTPKPSLPKRVSLARRPSNARSSRSTTKPVVKFDPESQFLPPPEDIEDVLSAPSTTKRFTTSSTTTPAPGSPAAAIPAHLRSKYRPRTDGRFIDFLRDPNRPRELKGFDLTDYPFYVRVPEDIEFECDDKKDGYYASVPHKCQLFHYCFAGARYDFLCANYTLYDQTTFTCRFANNVDCDASENFYYRNDDLWKETTTPAPETTTPKKRRTTPKDEDYDDEYEYDEYDEEEEERRRPPKRRRNRRKNRRRQQEESKKDESKKDE